MVKRIGRFFRRHQRRVLRVLLIVLVVWGLLCVGLGAAVYLYSRGDGARPADVIIVLGSGLTRGDRPGPALIRRATRAADLYAQGYASHVLCSGGYGIGRTRSEADGCREVLESLGVPRDAIVIEDRSRSTEENALYSHEIMRARGWQEALLVSDGYHLLRARWIFTDEGIPVYTTPAADPPLLNHLSSIGREIVAFHWLFLKKALNLPITYVPVL